MSSPYVIMCCNTLSHSGLANVKECFILLICIGKSIRMKGVRAHPAITHCSHLLLKHRVATNISNWLKVHSWWFKSYISAKNCILIRFWIFQYCIYYSFTIYLLCQIQLFECWIVFSLPSGCQTVWIQIRPDILSGLIWVQTVCIGYQHMTKVTGMWTKCFTEQLLDTTFRLKSISFGPNFFYLAKVLATTNSEPG